MQYKEVQKRYFKFARFAEPPEMSDGMDNGSDPAESGSGGGAGSAGSGEDKPKTLDDFLKDPAIKKDFDARINKAVNAGISNAQAKWQILMDDKVSEADKLARMNEQEKADYLHKKKEKELSDREAEITRRELMATAKNTLADKKLPHELASILVYTDAEACNKSITAVEKAFNEAVESAVKEQLKGGDPLKKPQDNNNTLEQQVAKAIAGGLY